MHFVLFLIQRIPRDRVHSFKLDSRQEVRALRKEMDIRDKVKGERNLGFKTIILMARFWNEEVNNNRRGIAIRNQLMQELLVLHDDR